MENPFPSGLETDGEILVSEDNINPEDQNLNTYDAFMKKHLQHYGYYTGQNAAYRENFRSLQEWKKNYDVRLGGQHDLSAVEEHFARSASFPPKLLDMPSVFSTDGTLSDELLHRTTQLVFHYQAGRKIPKLREPRNLYALTKEAGPQQATRWPSHIQVVSPAISFIDYIPNNPTPLYEPTGREPTPGVRGPQMGEMIYYNDPGRDLYFMRSRVAGCRMAMRTIPPPREYPDDNLTLEFESRFESGNLLKADKITDFDYELTLRTDLYTTKHTQWFFFRVRNMRPDKTYRFTIINLMKPSSLYNQGMKPVWYSEMNAKKNKIGWVRTGSNIRYYRNNMCGRDGRSYYSLTWTCEFPYKDDCCYFAHCFPYTYSDLQEYLLQLANDPVRSRFCKQRVLTRTLAGNLVYILTITSPSRNPEISRSKKAVVITARVHPGETNASWMMKGFLDYLTSSNADAKLLRDSFIFKIVPMLNPDGVIVGNYRCSLAGRDLNRNYKSVLKDSFPSIWHTKMMIKRLSSERQVVVYCDLHGHSRKNNIFIYGCENKHDRSKRLQERVFPLMLSKNASHVFSFESCKYKVQKSKEGTGRIVVWYMGVMNSYTMEATFGGMSLPSDRKNTHLSTKDLEMMGYHFCDTLLDYCDPDPSKVQACMRELQDHMKRQILKRLQLQNPSLMDINLDDYASDFESDTSGSDSSCDDGLPVHLLAIAPKLQRKKKFRSRRERTKGPTNKPSITMTTADKNSNNSNKTFADKAKPLRYSQANGRRKDERHGTSTAIVGSGANDPNSSNDKSSKKLPVVSLTCIDPMLGILLATRAGFYLRKSEYFEALTSAYLRSGVLMAPDHAKDYSLRYTSSNGKPPPDGTFAVKYLSNHVDHVSGQESDGGAKEEVPEMRNASCQWSPQPDSPINSESDDEEDVNKDAILAEEQYELLRQSALRRQLSADQQRMLARKHLVAVAAMQKRNDENQRVNSARSCFDLQSRQQPTADEGSKRNKTPESARIRTQESVHPDPNPSLALIARQGRPKSSTPVRTETTIALPPERTTKVPSPKEEKVNDNVLLSAASFNPEVDRARKQRPTKELPDSKDTEIPLPPQLDPASVTPRSDISARLRKVESQVNPDQTRTNVARHYFSKTKPDSNQQKASSKPTHSDSENLANMMADAPMKISFTESNQKDNISIPGKLASGKEDRVLEEAKSASRSRKQERSGDFDQLSAMMGNLSLHPSDEPLPGIPSGDSQLPVHPNLSLLNLSRPAGPKNTHQPDMKCMVKGEILFPKSTDKPSISNGMKKSNSIVMESETDTLTVQSSRSYKSKDEDVASTNQLNKHKRYQASDDSFFGMSDQLGLGVMPKNTRVPAVVANIAELRRSLLGQGREGAESSLNKKENPRQVVSHSSTNLKSVSEVFHSNDDAIPFSKRPRKRNVLMNQYTRKLDGGVERGIPIKPSKSDPEITREPSLFFHPTKEAVPADEYLSSDDDVDNASVIATADDKRRDRNHRNHHHRRHRDQAGDFDREQNHTRHRNDRRNHEPSSHQLESDGFVDDSYLRTTRSDPDGRRYTQGNATIEKPFESSVTNIRIGSRNTNRLSAGDQWFESQTRPEGSSGASRGDGRQHTVAAVSLNMRGEEDRVCVTTPALASRPVPPLLRYLSAKQGMKRK